MFQLQELVLGVCKRTWPSEMDFSSSISQFGTPWTSASGSCSRSAPSPHCRPSASLSLLTLSIILCRVASLILGISMICCSLSSYAFCLRWSSPPACSQTQARMETEPASTVFVAREMSANQNFRRSAMDSLSTVPASSVHSSSGLARMPLARRSAPAAAARTFHTRCMGSRSMSTAASPSPSLISSAKARAAFMATTLAPGPSVDGTTRTQRSHVPRASSPARSASASARSRQTPTQTGAALEPGLASMDMRSGQRCARSFSAFVPWKSMVWPRPMGTAKSTPMTPVKSGRYWFVRSDMPLKSEKVSCPDMGTGGSGRPSKGWPRTSRMRPQSAVLAVVRMS
mmetsp:Transcript_75335/g.243628  ORF Transcript_75335/g.243628 Transcript_75335/m.243628 type:complete len:343 (-) Transcript_75335:284-1312(-)